MSHLCCYQYSLDGLDSTLACVKVTNIAILTDADKEHYEKILFSSMKQLFYATEMRFLRSLVWIPQSS